MRKASGRGDTRGARRDSWKLRVALAVVPAALLGCADTLVGPGPVATAEATFDVVWEEFDALYPLFGEKAVDWDDARTRYRPQAVGAGDAELLDVLDRMLRELDDGHVFVRTPDTTLYSTAARRREPAYFDAALVDSMYVDGPITTVADGRIDYGVIGDVGYVRVRTLSGVDGLFGGTGAWTAWFDSALVSLADARGLVIDIRGNGGGSFHNGLRMAGRFATERRVVIASQFRNGPGRDDLSPPAPIHLEPRAPYVDRPVALLVNGHVGSAAETLTLAMQGLPRVMVVGTHTAGALGHQVERGLPNGWAFGLPVARVVTGDGALLEGVGVTPDSVVVPTAAHEAAGRDAILEAGLEVLDVL